MKLREFYEKNGIDYDAFLGRLMGKESLADKYIKLFLGDPTYTELTGAFLEKNYLQVEEKAHTLKGIALNLDLKNLSALCAQMMSVVQQGDDVAIAEQFGKIKLEYDYITSELQP